ncbi:ribosome biogenesis GTPase YlqF [uncultured Pseudacidovorax sp.]|uniref:ribosome biogenesis GTPase YlqF n=1 Tax=uncultured Pseudacidovorax sp. TaxID=679313 RepID=UPI0025E80135|nr:ribosome biogenesis GTPase YlqF [uncultured Pseudacidovorax sp.]
MTIQWFPGHMHATRKAITERMKTTDVVIELLDARLPGSSANPALAAITAKKPRLKILNKQDLADPARTAEWLAHYQAQEATGAIALDASQTPPAQRAAIIEACHRLSPNRGGLAKPMRVLICGVPNVGKSTLINTLSLKRQAKAADEAGVTKQEQRILLADDFYLYDTPGMLWPKIIVPESGVRLAATGAVGRNAYDDESVALDVLAYLKAQYTEPLRARYKLPADNAQLALCTQPDEDILAAIGRKRGALLGGGRIDMQKAAEAVLTDLRGGVIGRITLETVNQFLGWLAAGRKAEAELKRQRAAALRARGRGRDADAIEQGENWGGPVDEEG